MFQWPIVNANTRQIDHALMLQMHAGSIIWHTCQPETPKKTEIFGLICFITPHGPAGSRHLSGKQHNPILERLDSQHASFFAGIKKSLRFPKHLVALLEAPYIGQSALIRGNGRHSS